MLTTLNSVVKNAMETLSQCNLIKTCYKTGGKIIDTGKKNGYLGCQAEFVEFETEISKYGNPGCIYIL